ncbi:hypothetical protein [Litchfieldia salsa]|uniref:Uncharacterized protein n=1 Tax=Litchfieldia salsa TaxID=930152 RepID=A0A1H0VP85_9BACI|nr:hypothetical protein [Litchfieldia salsa]SDP79988.1 hypothetical protein SAMN05216565_107100 [Litchfieldia salsa]
MMKLSVVPDNFKDRDPRNLLYHFPSMPVVKYAKIMQEYCFFKQLKVAEEMAHKLGFILVPFDCMNWQRKKNFSSDRKVKIGRNSYFMMKLNELTKSENAKLRSYVDELREKAI